VCIQVHTHTRSIRRARLRRNHAMKLIARRGKETRAERCAFGTRGGVVTAPTRTPMAPDEHVAFIIRVRYPDERQRALSVESVAGRPAAKQLRATRVRTTSANTPGQSSHFFGLETRLFASSVFRVFPGISTWAE